MDLERFGMADWERGTFINERFLFVCHDCQFVSSPKFVLLTENETPLELKCAKMLYGDKIQRREKEIKGEVKG